MRALDFRVSLSRVSLSRVSLSRVSLLCLIFWVIWGGPELSRAHALEFKVQCPQSQQLNQLKKALQRSSFFSAWNPIYREASDLKRLYGLQQTLNQANQSGSRQGWQKVYREAHQLAETLAARRLLMMKNTSHHDNKLACAHSLALESAIYLSGKRATQRLWSARGIMHAVSLSSLRPQVLKTSSARSWLQLLVSRSRNRGRAHIFGSWRKVKIKAQLKPYHLKISVADRSRWQAHCGLHQACKNPPRWSVYAQMNHETQFSIPEGDYQLEWSGPCVQRQERLKISSRKARPLEITSPPLICSSYLTLIDATTQKVVWNAAATSENSDQKKEIIPQVTSIESPQSWDPTQSIPEGTQVKVKFRGYQEQIAQVPERGEPLRITLTRCQTVVQFDVIPNDSAIQGPQRLAWGQPSEYRFSRAGYLPLTRLVEIKRKHACESPVSRDTVELTRLVIPEPLDERKLPVELKHLEVGSFILNPREKTFARPEGRYRVRAHAQGYLPLDTWLEVPRCQTATCPPIKLQLQLTPPPPPPPSIATYLRGFGGGSLIIGAGVLIFAGQERSLYEDRLSFADQLSDARAENARHRTLALSLLIGGASLWLFSYALPWFVNTQEEDQP